MRIRIVSDNPRNGCSSIAQFIGNVYEVEDIYEDGKTNVDLTNNGSFWTIFKDEYEIITQ